MGIKHGARWALSWFSSTILDDIQHQVIFFTAFATMVCCVSNLTNRNLGIAPIMVTVTGTIVSLVVSFKTNSAYARWWEGRNLWASLTSSSRNLSMLIWLHVANTAPAPKTDPPADKSKDKDDKHRKRAKKAKAKAKAQRRADREAKKALSELTESPQEKQGPTFDKSNRVLRHETSEEVHETLLPSPTSGSGLVNQQTQPEQSTLLEKRNRDRRARVQDHPGTDTEHEAGAETSEDDGPFSWGRTSRSTSARPYTLEPLRDSPTGSRSGSRSKHAHGPTPDTARSKGAASAMSRKSTASTTISKLIKQEKEEDEEKMRQGLEGMLEKKTYIGLVQAFGVAMKHALRGEAGPFYSDLYDLIAFLPKYNTSALPPIQREDLFVPWINGIPRQKALYDDDSIAVPLTVPAPFNGYAFDMDHPHDHPRPPPPAQSEKGKDQKGESGSGQVSLVPPVMSDANADPTGKSAYPPISTSGGWPRGASFVNTPASGPTTSTAAPYTGSYPDAASNTTPAKTSASASDHLSVAPTGAADPEKTARDWSTTSPAFRSQAITSATSYLRSGSESHRHAFARLDKHHRVLRKSEDVRNGTAHITCVELMPPRHPPMAQWWDFFPPARLVKIVVDWVRKRERVLQQERVRGGRRKRGGGMRSEIPQEILMYLTAYVNTLIASGRLNTTIVSPIMTSLTELQKCMTDLDKIASTPIPSAYSFHLRLTVWAYLLFLPFQIYPLLGWNTIPAVAIAAITYLGFLEIGCQIEMPFGYDHSDLDLDKFTLKIARQLAEVTAFPTALPPSKIMLSNLNRPLLPTLSHSVPDLLGVKEVKPRATALGFEASYQSDSDGDAEAADRKDKQDKKGRKDPSSSSSSSDSDSESSSGTSSDEDAESASSSSSSSSATSVIAEQTKGKPEKAPKKPLPKSIRDVERALVANWHHVSGETEAFIGKPRHQLENRTGMEVAVMTL